MSDGLSWAYEQLKEEQKYDAHKASGKFSKEYLEADIVRLLTKDEISFLVIRLIIHQLGGIINFMRTERYSFVELFESLPKKEQKDFLFQRAKDLNMEVGYTNKLVKLRKKLEELARVIS